MAKRMNMVEGPLWWGSWARAPCAPPKSGAAMTSESSLLFGYVSCHQSYRIRL